MKEDEKGVAGMSSVIDEIREEGEQIGKQIGEQEGTQKTNLNAIKNVMESFNVTVDIAMDSLKIPQNEKETYAALLRNEG